MPEGPGRIDLNDVWQPPARLDLATVRERLTATAEHWLPDLFSQARLSSDRKTLRCADLSGRPPRKEGSCIIHLRGPRAGWGYDHATGESAGPIDLVHYATGLSDRALFEEVARLARIERPVRTLPASSQSDRPRDHAREVARILEGCLPLAGSAAETYLQSRGLQDPVSPDLLFHPDLTDYETKRGWPGMVAIVRDGMGTPTGGIHRTFLLDDGSAKAPAGKKMLEAVAGGSVRLSALPEDGHLGIAEGIETALSAQAIFGVPTWAALSADGLRRWQWPDGVAWVTIFADAGDVGRQAAGTLSDRLNAANIPNQVVAPLHGDDFNDDLRRGATAADYPVAEPAEPAVSPPPVPATVAEFEAVARGLGNPPDVSALGTLIGQLAMARLDPFAGSVNPETYLRDETGNRRFWPVRCGTIDLDALQRDRDQLWAEAVVRYREGVIWWLQDPALIAMAEEAQTERMQSDAWDGLIERWIGTERRRVNRGYVGYDDWQEEELRRSSPLADVSVGEILEQAIGVEPGHWSRADQMRVTAWLKANGWRRYQARADVGREWRYRR